MAAPSAGAPPTTRPEIALQGGHEGGVTALAFSPDGRFLASGGQDASVRLWDAASGMVSRTLLGHADRVGLVRFSRDGQFLVSQGKDDSVRVWDLRRGEVVQQFAGRHLAVSAEAGRLAWATAANEVRVGALGAASTPRVLGSVKEDAWDFQLEQTEAARITRLAFSPDGRLLVAASTSGTLRVWDVESGKRLGVLEGHVEALRVPWFAVLPGSSTVLSAGDVKKAGCPCPSPMPNMCMAEQDGRRPGAHLHYWDTAVALRWWDARSGRVTREVWIDDARTALDGGFRLSADGRYLAGRGLKDLTVWDAGTGARLWHAAPADELYAVEFGPDGRTLSGRHRGGVWVWNSATGEALPEAAAPCAGLSDIWALSADGRDAACGSSEGTVSHHRAGSAERWESATVQHSVDGLAYGADGRFLATGTGKGGSTLGWRKKLVQVWDLAAGQLLRSFEGHPAGVALSPDGRLLFPPARLPAEELNARQHQATRAGRSVQAGYGLQDVATGTLVRLLHAFLFSDPSSVSFSADGRVMVAASGLSRSFGRERGYEGDRQLRAWDTATGELLLWQPERRQDSAPFLPQPGVIAAAVTPDGRLAVGGISSQVEVYEVATRQRTRTMSLPRDGEVTAIAVSPDGQVVAAANGPALRLWNLHTGALERSWTTPGTTTTPRALDVLALAFAPDGRHLVSAGRDSAVRVWERATGREVRALRGHSADVLDLAFSRDGRLLLSGSDDGSVRFWQFESGRPLGVLVPQPRTGDWAVVAADGRFDGTQRGIQRLVGWRFADNATAPLELFFSEFYTPGLLGALARGEQLPPPPDLAALDRRQPRLRLSSAQPGAAATARTLELQVEVAEAPADAEHTQGSGARDLRLFRNGSLVKVWRGDVLQGQPSATLSAEVDLVAGENRLTAYAFNRDDIKSADAELVVKGDASLARKGTAFILAVGLNRYANPDYDLKFAAPDARAFAETLAAQQGKLGTFGEVVVASLLDGEATKANILGALARLSGAKGGGSAPSLARLKRAQPEDAVFVYFAGHGTAAGERFYLIPHDLGYTGRRAALDAAGLQAILAHGLSDRELELAFEKVDAGRLLLVIDACNSGQALEAEEKRRGPMNSKGLAQLAYEKGMSVLTASQGYQAALEASQLGHGLLTYALVEEGLKSRAADVEPADGQVVLREWLDHAARRVPDLQRLAMREAQTAGRALAFVEEEAKVQPVEERALQRPRVFYRREPENEPLVVAAPGGGS